MELKMDEVKLTKYSHGAGCGCKIAPSVLSKMLESSSPRNTDPRLLVGNESADDAAVFDLGDGTAVVSTTDFFMPIVDDPFTFGKIAATNAISDIYAMGGTPLLAIAILGWPIKLLEPEVARQVLEGGRAACRDAGITLAGGHSIDSPEPIFGLAVTGKVEIDNLKRNDTAKEGCKLFLTKPLGVGVLTTAQKQGKLQAADEDIAPLSMTQLNSIGLELAKIKGVKAMTDVTGFGLLGHLTEMCQGSKLTAEVEFDKIPVFERAAHYIAEGCIPGGTHRNWDSYGHGIKLRQKSDRLILCDPQTSGGLLIAVEPDAAAEVKKLLNEHHLNSEPFGKLMAKEETLIRVI